MKFRIKLCSLLHQEFNEIMKPEADLPTRVNEAMARRSCLLGRKNKMVKSSSQITFLILSRLR